MSNQEGKGWGKGFDWELMVHYDWMILLSSLEKQYHTVQVNIQNIQKMQTYNQ